jgi:hypothetical protein
MGWSPVWMLQIGSTISSCRLILNGNMSEGQVHETNVQRSIRGQCVDYVWKCRCHVRAGISRYVFECNGVPVIDAFARVAFRVGHRMQNACSWWRGQTNKLRGLSPRANYTNSKCGLVVRVPGYRSSGPGLIPGATRFSEKWWVWNGVHSASWVQLRSYLKEKVVDPV